MLRHFVFLTVFLLSANICVAESNYLDPLTVNPVTGEVFPYSDHTEWPFRGEWRNPQLGEIKVAFPVMNDEIRNKIEVVYDRSESPSDNLLTSKSIISNKLSEWVSCDNPNEKRTTKRFYVITGIHKFNYVVDGNIIGSYQGYIVGNKAIYGEYKFINGEEHRIMACVNSDNSMASNHTIVKLSVKGQQVKNAAATELIKDFKYKFNDNGTCISLNDVSYQSNDGLLTTKGILFDFNTKEQLSNQNKLNENLKFRMSSSPDKPLNYVKYKLPKCDGTNYTIKDTPIVLENVSDKEGMLLYYFSRKSLGNFMGFVQKDRGEVRPIAGTFFADNGEAQDYSICNDNGNPAEKLVLTVLSKAGNLVLREKEAAVEAEKIKEAEQEKRRIAENAAATEKARLDNIKWEADYKEKLKKEALVDAENKKKFAAFKKNAKAGTKVGGPGGNLRGTITSVKGNMVEVQYTEEAYFERFANGNIIKVAKYRRIPPVKEWVERNQLQYP